MKQFVTFALSFVLGAAFVLITGMLAIQASGTTTGAVFNLDNQVVAVTRPHVPYLQLVASAVLGAVVIGVSVWSVLSGTATRAVTLNIGLILGVIPLIVWSAFLTTGRLAAEARPEALPSGLPGWVLYGGGSGIVHVAALVGVAALVFRVASARAGRRPLPSATTAQMETS